DAAVDYHKLVLELAPYHLTISPLDVDYVELMYGFDLECKQNHDAVVYEALYADTALGGLLNASIPSEDGPAEDEDGDGEEASEERSASMAGSILDVQPIFGQSLNASGDLQAYYEVKTRPKSRRGSSKRYSGEPISLFLTIRKYGPVDDLGDMAKTVQLLNAYAEELATAKLIPDLLTPITQQIGSSA
ncbi:MAG: hypothetical protein AAGA25_16330, partial [Planctomycetota bacterium]